MKTISSKIPKNKITTFSKTLYIAEKAFCKEKLKQRNQKA
jgi:hypothetical protein